MGVREAKDGGPFAVPARLPDDLSTEERGCLGGLDVVMKVEVADIGGLVPQAKVRLAGRGSPLGGEEEGGVVAGGIRGESLHFVEREVGDGEGVDGGSEVAEIRAFELGGGRPGSEDGGMGELFGDEADCLLVESNHVAIGKVVFGREGVGGREPDGGGEGGEAEGGDGSPEAQVTAPLDDADEKDEGI